MRPTALVLFLKKIIFLNNVYSATPAAQKEAKRIVHAHYDKKSPEKRDVEEAQVRYVIGL
jgi:hypothetical protein